MLHRATLIRRSLLYYHRTHVGVLLGVALCAAILTGAMLVGDSVRYSLLQLALSRLGKTDLAIVSGDRFFSASLSERLSQSLQTDAAPLLHVRGTASADGGRRRANSIDLYGVDAHFWALAPRATTPPELPPEQAVLSRKVAERLELRVGDIFLLRVEKPDALPREAPLSSATDTDVALRVTVAGVVDDAAFGRFSLRAGQTAPLNVYVSLTWLAQRLDVPERANLLLLALRPGKDATVAPARQALASQWRLEDVGLTLRDLSETGEMELTSSRIFLDPAVVDAARRISPDSEGILTYFVNQLRHGERATPYSFVCAPGSLLLPPDLPEDAIVVSSWLADDLGLSEGDPLEMDYYVLGPLRRLEERTRSFRVHSIIPLERLAAVPGLIPPFPGLADAKSCRDWDPGVPIDLARIRKTDEAYWREHQGTPKALVSITAAQSMWSNRFGQLTALRFPTDARPLARLAGKLVQTLDPGAVGLALHPVRAEAIRASTEAMDFGQLFIGLSFFIVIAALALTSLLFVLAIEQRAGETGLLLAIGYPQRRVRRLLLVEGTVLAAAGTAVGTPLAVLYTRTVLWALGSVWQGAVGTSALQTHIAVGSVAAGAAATLLAALATMWITLRKQVTRNIRELQEDAWAYESASRKVKRRRAALLGLGCLIGVVVILCSVDAGRGKNAVGTFFGAGALLLLGGISLANAVLLGLAQERTHAGLSLRALILRGCARRRGRSLATVGTLACGVFLVIAVAANRHSPLVEAQRRESGTGGFAFYAETTLPILHNLNTDAGRKAYHLDAETLDGVSFVHLRLRTGDEASCLNLNRVKTPRVLGVDPAQFADRDAFTFAQLAGDVGVSGLSNPWLALDADLGPDVIPAIADRNVIIWSLGTAVGESIDMLDEAGRPIRMKFVAGLSNSVLQGSIIIGDNAFERLFPSVSGTRAFLVDAPHDRSADLQGSLSTAFQDVGMELEPAAARLAEFAIVENTYLSIFLALGGMGLLLGTVGMALVVSRNVLERRHELALLRSLGFSRRRICMLVFREHTHLLLAGLLVGTTAAVVAVLPSVLTAGGLIPYRLLAVLLAALGVSGLVWTLLAARLATAGALISALRNE